MNVMYHINLEDLLLVNIFHDLASESVIKTFEPTHDKTNKTTCAPSKDSDQPGHPSSLISLYCPQEESLCP